MNPNETHKQGWNWVILYYAFAFLIASLVAGCSNKPPVEQQQAIEVVKLPEALQALPIGASIKYGDWYYTKVNDSAATRMMPQLQPVIKKCKNCFNQTDKHKDKSKTKEKEKTETVTKNKQDQSVQKKAETDNSVGKTGVKPTANLWDEIKNGLLLLALLGCVILVVKVFR